MPIIITSQDQWDALPAKFPDYTIIEIRTGGEIVITSTPANSRVEARGSSSVEARESSRVVAWGSSRVVAWGSSRVVAWGQTTTHHRSNYSPTLHGQAVCFRYPDTPEPVKASDTCVVIQARIGQGVSGWLEREGIAQDGGSVILYKRVSAQYKTQEDTPNETTWTPGAVVTHPAWNPGEKECGPGKFHACSRPYFCDEFRSESDDIYIAVRIAVQDLYAWDGGEYPHKIAFRSGEVLYRVDRWGEKEIA